MSNFKESLKEGKKSEEAMRKYAVRLKKENKKFKEKNDTSK